MPIFHGGGLIILISHISKHPTQLAKKLIWHDPPSYGCGIQHNSIKHFCTHNSNLYLINPIKFYRIQFPYFKQVYDLFDVQSPSYLCMHKTFLVL